MSFGPNLSTCANGTPQPPPNALPDQRTLPKEEGFRATGESNDRGLETGGVSKQEHILKEETLSGSTTNHEPAPISPDPSSPSDGATQAQAVVLYKGIRRLRVSEERDDLPELQRAPTGELHSGSYHIARRLWSKEGIAHTRRSSEPGLGIRGTNIVGQQRASLLIEPSHRGRESVEAGNSDDKAQDNSSRGRGPRPLSFLGLDISGERLRDQLVHVTRKSGFGRHRKFIPERQLFQLLTPTAIELDLKKCKPSLRRRLRNWRQPAASQDFQSDARKICGYHDSSLSARNGAGEDSQTSAPKEYRKIFGILLLIDKPHRIRSFIEEEVCDEDLPLVKATRDSSKLVRMKSPDKPLSCFNKWSASTIARFEERQWSVLAPIFKWADEGPVDHCKLRPDAILPFTAWDRVKTRGGFGQVYKANIHPDHNLLDPSGGSKQVVAVKELFKKQKLDFNREVRVMNSLGCERHAHAHLITLLATFEQNDQFYLIMPWAEADLLGYWKRINPQRPEDRNSALWLVEQCQGLAEALSRIHRWETYSATGLLHPSSMPVANSNRNSKGARPSEQRRSSDTAPLQKLFGRHGDIKPENILWFSDGGRGILKIADFGIAHFSTRDAVPAAGRGPIPNSLSYRAPECDLPNWMLSPAADVWALGCVFLEFVTWLSGGWKAVESFARSRQALDPSYPKWANFHTDTFFTIEGHGTDKVKATVKNEVSKRIDDLRSEPTCSDLFRDFLGMIQQCMLQVQQNYSDEKQEGRKCSRKIAEELSGIVVKCRDQPSYYSAGLEDGDHQHPKVVARATKKVGFEEGSKLDGTSISYDSPDTSPTSIAPKACL